MEALAIVGIIANFAGIISLAIEIAKILDKPIKNARIADKKVQLIAVKLRVHGHNLKTLQAVFKKDQEASGDRLFTKEDCDNIDYLTQQCDEILHEIKDSFARMGQVVEVPQVRLLSDPSGSTTVIPHEALKFEFSFLGRLRWSVKSPEILQSVDELDHLMIQLQSIFNIAEIARRAREREREKRKGWVALKKSKWVGALRRRWKSSAVGRRLRTAHPIEAKQQLCLEAAPTNDLFTLTSPESLVSGRMVDFPFGSIH